MGYLGRLGILGFSEKFWSREVGDFLGFVYVVFFGLLSGVGVLDRVGFFWCIDIGDVGRGF